jgi:DNA repair protein RadC
MLTTTFGEQDVTWDQECQHPADADASVPQVSPTTADALARLLGLPLSTAAGLLEEYGSLARLRRASPDALRRGGLTPRRAAQLMAALDLAVVVRAERPQVRPRVTSAADAARLLVPEMSVLESEQMRVLLLNTKNRLIAIVTLYTGTVSACQIRVGEIFREAVRHNATSLILVHNHPSDDPTPSPEDVAITREIVRAGQLLDVEVLDHLVIGGDTYTSLRERGVGWE